METVEIVLKDGYKITAELNGNNYIPESTVADAELTRANLETITIDGEEKTNMACINNFIDVVDNKQHLIFREVSTEELEKESILKCIADLYEASLGGAE